MYVTLSVVFLVFNATKSPMQQWFRRRIPKRIDASPCTLDNLEGCAAWCDYIAKPCAAFESIVVKRSFGESQNVQLAQNGQIQLVWRKSCS